MPLDRSAESKAQSKTPKARRDEVAELRARLEEAEETLRAIRSGEVDALVVSAEEGERVYTLAGADHPYRVLIEEMNEGAATLTPNGIVLYCNRRFAAMLRVPLERVIGSSIEPWIAPANRMTFLSLLERGAKVPERAEIALQTGGGLPLPALLSLGPVGTTGALAVGMVATDLTEQKRSEAIIAAESLSRSILDQVTEAIVVCDEHGWIDRASHAAQALCGRDPVGRSFLNAFPLEMPDGKHFPLMRVLGGENVRGIEARLVTGDRTLDLLVSAGPLTDARHHPLGCIVTLTDVGERKRAEEALRAVNERFAAVLEASPVTVFTQDRDLRYTWIANPAADYHGVQLQGRAGVATVEQDEDARRLIALKRAVLADGQTRREEVRVRRQGEERWYDLHVRAQCDAAGAIVGLLCTAMDITEHKRMDETLRRSEAIYRRLADANLIGVGFGDTQGRTFYANEELLRMMGYTRADYEAGKINWGESLAPEHRAGSAQWGEDLLREGRIIGYERAFLRPDGGRTPYIGAAALLSPGEDFHVRIALDLTRIRAAEEALRESEARYRSLFEGSPVPIWEEDFGAVAARFAELRAAGVRDFRAYLTERPEEVRRLASLVKIVDVNAPSLELFGARTKDQLATDLPSYFLEESWDTFRDEMIALAEGRTAFHADMPIADTRGGRRVISLHLAVAQGCEESLSRVLVSFQDITERQQAEEAVRLANERFIATIGASPLVAFVQDRDLRYVWIFNPTPGFSLEEVTGKTDAELMENEDEARHVMDLKRAVLEDGNPRRTEVRFHRGGFEYWYDVYVHPQRDADGAVVGLLGTALDIGERKRAEMLQLANERFDAALQTSPVLVYTQDRDLRYTWVFNPRIFHSAEESLGKTDAELFDDPEDTQAIMAIKRAALADGKPRREKVRLRHRGVEYWFDMYVRPQYDAAGAVTGLLGTSTEVQRRPL